MDPPAPALLRPGRPFLQRLDVAPHGLVGLHEFLAGLIEHQLGRVHDDIGMSQFTQFAQLLGGEFRLRRRRACQ